MPGISTSMLTLWRPGGVQHAHPIPASSICTVKGRNTIAPDCASHTAALKLAACSTGGLGFTAVFSFISRPPAALHYKTVVWGARPQAMKLRTAIGLTGMALPSTLEHQILYRTEASRLQYGCGTAGSPASPLWESLGQLPWRALGLPWTMGAWSSPQGSSMPTCT